MELKIGVQELARALARSQGIVEKKSTMPILSHVLLEAAKGDRLHVSATDLDISVASEHACEVLKDGKVAVPAKQLYEIVKSLPEKDVLLKRASNNYLELTSGAAEFRIVGLPADDFPGFERHRSGNHLRREDRVPVEDHIPGTATGLVEGERLPQLLDHPRRVRLSVTLQ
jgi:DNA polymerase III subunit beta